MISVLVLYGIPTFPSDKKGSTLAKRGQQPQVGEARRSLWKVGPEVPLAFCLAVRVCVLVARCLC